MVEISLVDVIYMHKRNKS